MKEEISICKRHPEKDSLIVVDVKKMKTELDEIDLKVYCKYNRKRYEVKGNCFMQYIVIE